MSTQPLRWSDPREWPNAALVSPSLGGQAFEFGQGQLGFLAFLKNASLNQLLAERQQSLEARARTLPKDERQRLLFVIGESLGADAPSLGVEKTPGVVGGSACLVRTRIPVWILESYRRSGFTIERILRNFPTIRRSDVVSAWVYARVHGEEIENDIRENDEEPG